MKPKPQDHKQHWLGMPEFTQETKKAYAQIIVRVDNAEALSELSKRLEQPFTTKTKSAWFPFKSHWGAEKKTWITDES